VKVDVIVTFSVSLLGFGLIFLRPYKKIIFNHLKLATDIHEQCMK